MPRDSVRIVVVDDNPATRYSTSRILRSAQWTVIEAGTGDEALAAIDATIDLVVLDVNLPDISGFEVCGRLRKSEAFSRLPVIHLSATFVKDIDRIHGLEAGADGYLVHPIEPPVLIATVRAFLRARQAEQDREQLLVSERAARSEAEQANRLKDDFLATLSHELRTPLHAIIGWSQVLRLGNNTAEEVAEGLEAIERNAQAQAQMIADLLDISRITSGKIRLDTQPIDPAATVEAAISAILPAADAKGIRIVRTLDPSAGTITGDPARLQQIIWNLVNNAVKFTPKDGKIQVTLSRVNSHIEIAVADNGMGIAPDALSRIFERFSQVDSSSTREHGGLGLGLAIARQLVELHGGTIKAESGGLGCGSKFSIFLPLSPSFLKHNAPLGSQARQAEDLMPVDLVRLDDVRVFVVDDDVDARQMLTKILTACGAVVKAANSAAEALETIEDFRPEVLVSDLGMPNQDGFALIQKVRAKGFGFQQLPAIALTGFARVEDRRRALIAGFQVHMTKPVDPRELTAAIATLVGRTGL